MGARPIRLLLVDDDEDEYIVSRDFLSEIGKEEYELDWVSTYDAALEAMGHNQHDAYLIDYRLGGRSGLELLREARGKGCKTPMILLTGQGDREVDMEAMKTGAADYLVKGQIDANLLERSIRYAIAHHRAEEQIQCQMRRLGMLSEFGLAISRSLDLSSILHKLLEKLDQFLHYPFTATIRLFNEHTKTLEFVACRHVRLEEMKAYTKKARHGLAEIVFESKAPVMVSDIRKDPRTRDAFFFHRLGLHSYLGVPLIAKNKPLGVLAFVTKEKHEFNNQEIEFLQTIGSQAAIVIHNSQLYEKIKNQATELEQAIRVKDEFLSVVSHELRTPLNVVKGYATMIKDGIFGEINLKQRVGLEKVLVQTDQQLELINSILQVTQLESGKLNVVHETVNVRELLKTLKETYWAPNEKDIILEWHVPVHLPLLVTDSIKLRQILQNLINNAIKFTEKGIVSVSAKHIIHPGAIRFTVSDTGIGIPKSALDRVFEKFYQVDSCETRGYGGSGLGLYIVKKFSDLLGAKLEVQSNPGIGTTFSLTVPAETLLIDTENGLAPSSNLLAREM